MLPADSLDPLAPTPRRIAITGSRSYIGRGLIHRAQDDRNTQHVLALDLKPPERLAASDGTQDPRFAFARVDLTQPAAEELLVRAFREHDIDTVVHAAFLSGPTHATGWAHELEDVGTMYVSNACRRSGVRKLILASTTLVYGADPRNPNYIGESRPLPAPASRWLRDRISAEKQARRLREDRPDITVTILRAAPTLGASIDNFVSRLLSRPVVPRLWGADPLIQLLHEEDLLAAYELALLRNSSRDLNIVGDGVLPLSTLLALMGRVPLFVPHRLARAAMKLLWVTQLGELPPAFLEYFRYLCVADGALARERLGFKPRYDIRQTLVDFLGLDPSGEHHAAWAR